MATDCNKFYGIDLSITTYKISNPSFSLNICKYDIGIKATSINVYSEEAIEKGYVRITNSQKEEVINIPIEWFETLPI